MTNDQVWQPACSKFRSWPFLPSQGCSLASDIASHAAFCREDKNIMDSNGFEAFPGSARAHSLFCHLPPVACKTQAFFMLYNSWSRECSFSQWFPRFSENHHIPSVPGRGSSCRGCASRSGLQKTQGFPTFSKGGREYSEVASWVPSEACSSGVG